MKNIFSLCIFLMVNFCIYAESMTPPSTCNYMQIDGFLYDYQLILSDNSKSSGKTYQIFTGRPAFGFCFQLNDINIRPNIALNPYNSSTEGSLLFGREFHKKLELGLYTLVNSSQKTLGEGNYLNETLESNFLIGPYIFIYPKFNDEDLFEFFFRVAYEYDIIQNTVNNSTTLMTKKAGINIATRFLYGMKIKEHLIYSPNIEFIYSYTIDMVGGNIAKNLIETKILPISIRWEF
ncbi:hypothetical protein [Silvanigrella sp.]|jgi:hypothetical protein|uniref:hypothetical protein n=1 Tax=Silvanigrella sp. TaxID=2024976 RepID=UPI0037C8C7AC